MKKSTFVISMAIVLLIASFMVYYERHKYDNKVAMTPTVFVNGSLYINRELDNIYDTIPESFEFYGIVEIYDDYDYDDDYQDLSTNVPQYMNLEAYIDPKDNSTIYLKNMRGEYLMLRNE